MMNRKPGIKNNSAQRGISLVVVLGCVVFLSVLILAFLSGAKTELKSSKLYADGSSVRLLAQSVVNIVTAEINTATRSVSNDGTRRLVWASQPGMIRTYDDTKAKGNFYKLYSSDQMIVNGNNFDINDELVPTDWHKFPALYTDLNEPAVIPGSGTMWPIINGDVVSVTGVEGKTYADSTGKQAIDGFRIASDTPVEGSDGNQVPMPVRWLYVLAKGEVVAPTIGADNAVEIAEATPNNPVVGRIAFWTDDESCKINVNTASEGTYWDTPRITSKQDWDLANIQPAQKEFQRYPGHPAMVSLSSVFKNAEAETSEEKRLAWLEEIYKVTPRVAWGGSKGGSVPHEQIKVDENGNPSVPSKTDRLYTTVDELFFKPSMSNGSREPQDSAVFSDPRTLERSKFFLTANSRSPDVNLFGLPRVSMWPITLDADGVAQMSAYDKLIAFCTRINNSVYYFQRQQPREPLMDLPETPAVSGLGRNRMLLEYLRYLSAQKIPGFGVKSFQEKYSTKNPSGKGSDGDQILTQIFDYIRTTNLRDPHEGATKYTTAVTNVANTDIGLGQVVPIWDAKTQTRGFGRFPTVYSVALHFIGVADNTTNSADFIVSGTVLVPKVNPDKIRVQAAVYVQMFDPSQGLPMSRPIYSYTIRGLDQFAWGDGVSALVPMGFASPHSVSKPVSYENGQVTFFGGVHDIRAFFNSNIPVSDRTGYPGQAPDFPTEGIFKFSGGTLEIDIYNTKHVNDSFDPDIVQTVRVKFPAEDFPVPLLPPGRVTSYNVTSPSPVDVNYRTFKNLSGNALRATGTDTSLVSTYGRLLADSNYPPITSKDVVRSMVAVDPRLVAARKDMTDSDSEELFEKHTNYSKLDKHFAHVLRNGLDGPYYGASGGKLVTVSYPGYSETQAKNDIYPLKGTASQTELRWGFSASRDPDVATNTGVFSGGGDSTVPGDWDNGISNSRDGAYINRVDEGNRTTKVSSSTYVAYFGLPKNQTLVVDELFSPNRLVPSPGVLGSLPSEVWAKRPWQTLLFRPGPAGHRGLEDPPDHLLLDWFNMPVVEPYAISEPLSTGGRINMNFQIMPFAYIKRETALYAAMKSQLIPTINASKANKYKTIYNTNSYNSSYFDQDTKYRVPLNIAVTLKQFYKRFEVEKDLFRSASEICAVDLVPTVSGAPQDPDRANMDQFWYTHRLTGDNLREKPYATLYPLLTTKSNTFTVHMRVQTLQKVAGTDDKVWTENRDKVTGEYRGSQTIERYVDPNDPNIVDFASPANYNATLDDCYRFRVVYSRQFAP